jgi:ABC-type oligopeptide transport system substrate-binding subunit
MQCAASERPLVLVCEDLHWADPTSIELLQQLLALTERVPLLLLCVFRPLKEHGCWRFRELTAQTYAHRHTDIVLDPLSPAQSEALVANLLRIEELPDVLRERILSRAEGNPFYVEEVIRSLIDRSAIVQEKATGRWTATRAVAEIPIPDTLQGVLMARIDRLQEDAKRVLQMASVIGRIFLYRVLVDIAEEERTLDEQLLTLQHEEMIRERTRIPELEYIFKHDLTREAAYNGLLKKERRVFHRQVGEALETLFPDRVEEQLGLLAYHWERAGDAEKATEYLLRAGDQARLLYAHAEAIDYYERALVFLEEQEEHERAARTLMKLGLTHQIAFDFKHARQAYERAFSMWQRVPSSEAAVTPAPAPHALREWGFVDSVDPALAFDPISLNVASALFSGLTQRRPELDVAPDVAQRWEVLEHGRKYLFHLRDDVRWSDGVRLTAQDFEYAWKRVLDPATGALTASLLYDVKGARDYHCGREANPDSVGVRALDGLTLMVELEKPTGHFLRLLDAFAYAVPRHVVERHSTAWTELDNIVTTGAFRLESWQRGELAVLVRNPDYHGNFRGNVQRVELRRVRDWGAQLQMYEAGELDALWLFPGHYSAIELDRAREGHADEYVSSPELSTYFVSFDVGRTPFQDSRVRRAFALAIDKEALAHVVMGGYRFPASGGFVPPGIPGHSAGIGLAYDPQVARRLLAEAGYAGGSAFPVVQGTTMARGDWIEYLQAQWREHLAVETRWERVEMEGLPTRNSRDRPHLLAHAHIADYPDPHNFLSTHMPWNRLGWRHDGFEELVEEASRVMDQARRLKLYMQADRILVEEAAIVPLTYGRWHWLVKPWVRNYLGGWMDIVIDPH